MLGTSCLTLITAFEAWSPNTQASQGALVVKNLCADAGSIRDAGSIPGLGRPPGRGHGNHFGILAWMIPWSLEVYSPQSLKESDTTEVT